MGNKQTTDQDEDILRESIYKEQKPCLRYIADHPRFQISNHILIKYHRCVINDPRVMSVARSEFIGAKINESLFDKPAKEDDLEHFVGIYSGNSPVARTKLMNVDNRWKRSKYRTSSVSDDNILCVWHLEVHNDTFPNAQKKCGALYHLHYMQIIGDEPSVFITFKLLILTSRRARTFLISPDCNYLLIFGEGCNFLQLPNIFDDLHQHALHTVKTVDAHYHCNACNKHNLFAFQSYPDIATAHFVTDHQLLAVDHFYSDVGVVPCEMELYLLDVTKLKQDDKHKTLVKHTSIHGSPEQFVMSSQGFIAFWCGQYTKYAPWHLVSGWQKTTTRNHLWMYKLDQQNQATLVAHNYSLSCVLRRNWRTLDRNGGNAQIVSREYDGVCTNRHWMIVCDASGGCVYIFDVPSLTLTWQIPMQQRFRFNISSSQQLSPTSQSVPYICSHGVVVRRQVTREYGSAEHRRCEADFALQPVPFWSQELITKLLRPHLSFVDPLIDVILAYIASPEQLEDTDISSHLRYIQANCVAISDGFDSFVVMASYHSPRQLQNIKMAQRDLNAELLKTNQAHQCVLFKIKWSKLLEYQNAPQTFIVEDESTDQREKIRAFDTACIDYVAENGSFLRLCHSMFESEDDEMKTN